MQLSAYLDRIGWSGALRPDLDTLTALMHAHLAAVSFENLDQQLGRAVATDAAHAYDKIVARRRGGWCFEVNTLLEWALRDIGFSVAPLSGHVGRSAETPALTDNHKCLRVDLDEGAFLVDVGYGGSQLAPLPLTAGSTIQAPYALHIAETGDGFWRLTDDAHGSVSSFDFLPDPVPADRFEGASHTLQSDPGSPFVRNLTAQRRLADRHLILRGKVLKTVTAEAAEDTLLHDADDLVTCLRETFALDMPEAATLWPRIEARHAELFPIQA